ncbi:MAG: hypothetical protein WDN69_37975 [Aliidongia sp.]
MTIAAWRVLVFASLLAGCTVGPDYDPPAPPSGSEAPLVSTVPSAETPDQPPDDWWRLYTIRCSTAF